MNVNEFFKEAGSTRNKRVICADGFEMSVQAHAGAYCSPRVPVQTVTNVIAKHGGIVEGEVPRGVAPIPANFTADI